MSAQHLTDDGQLPSASSSLLFLQPLFTMPALFLYVVDQHRSMITIRHGMIDHYAERQHPAIMNLMVTSENNDRKIHLPRSRCVMSHRCKRNPRYTGYRRKGIRTIRLGFNSLAILILLHISADIFVKYAEILIPFCPDI